MTLSMWARRFFFVMYFSVFLCILGYIIFKPIYISSSIIIPYSLHPYDICITNPSLWKYIKFYFVIFYLLSAFICSNSIYSLIFRNKFNDKFVNKNAVKSISKSTNSKDLSIIAGKDENNNLVFIPEKSLYQNILITGTIGSGKTSSCMYPFTKQLINYNKNNANSKLGMLILDVKGNYYKEVINFANSANRLSDLYVIELGNSVKYNPLDKPNLKPAVLANRLKTILMLFSPNNSDSYWLDKVEQVLAESIKFCRLYNNGYVTFVELHKLITIPDYYKDKIKLLREKFLFFLF